MSKKSDPISGLMGLTRAELASIQKAFQKPYPKSEPMTKDETLQGLSGVVRQMVESRDMKIKQLQAEIETLKAERTVLWRRLGEAGLVSLAEMNN